MKKVAIYVRSSKDKHDVSCDAQESQITELVKRNGESIYRVFKDKALSSTRDVRPEFDEMISLAMSKNPSFKKIYCLDTSRFGRDQHETQVLLYELRRKHGIDVIFTNMPNTGTYLDPAFEAIMSAFDYIHSQQSKAKGVASMKQNIRSGYRAGGQAPYGYKLEKIEFGKHRSGEMITKTKLVPDPETSKIAREYFERRSKLEARRSILEDFYHRGIPSPNGLKAWPVATAKSIEDNIEVYLGHTIFNRHNERVKIRGKLDGYLGGQKWRPSEEWVIEQNTHEPLISEEIADAIRQIKDRGLRDAPYDKRIYPLSGTMKCGVCGTGFIGDSGVYRCNAKSKPGTECDNNGISQLNVEGALFTFIDKMVLNFKNVSAVIERIQKRFNTGKPELSKIEKALARVEKEREKVINLYQMSLIEDDEVQEQMKRLNYQRKRFQSGIDELRAAEGAWEISKSEIKAIIDNLSKEVSHADPKIKKRVFQTLFRDIRIFPKEGTPWERMLEIKGVHLPLTRVSVASQEDLNLCLPAENGISWAGLDDRDERTHWAWFLSFRYQRRLWPKKRPV